MCKKKAWQMLITALTETVVRIGEGGGKECNCKQSEERLPEKAVHEEKPEECTE